MRQSANGTTESWLFCAPEASHGSATNTYFGINHNSGLYWAFSRAKERLRFCGPSAFHEDSGLWQREIDQKPLCNPIQGVKRAPDVE
jgi:hypothetical protein